MRSTSLALMALLAAGTAAADYPDKPVTLVVPFSAGGPTDKIGRDLAEAMRKPLGATLVIENAAARWVRTASPRPRPTATRCCCTTSAWPARRRSTPRCPTGRWTTSNTSAWLPRCR
jgi:hypothetical protein